MNWMMRSWIWAVLVGGTWCSLSWSAPIHRPPPRQLTSHPSYPSKSLLSRRVAKAKGPRIALVVGHNRGDKELKPLQFAERDAKRFAQLLQELGGYKPSDVRLLLSPNLAKMRQAMKEIQQHFQGKGKLGSFLLYYSGHSKTGGFQLGEEQLAFSEISRFVKRLPTRVRLVFVDSCFSGQLIRAKGVGAKGARRVKNLGVEVQQLAALKVEGTAILTSSAADGRSYESDRIKSSLFTSSLLAGLRGAADKDRDKQVSLSEVLNYVYRRTVERSTESHVTQTPEYWVDIKGRGSLFLTQLQRAEAQITFGSGIRGHCFLFRKSDRTLVHEFLKRTGKPVEVGLPQGDYQIQVRRKGWVGVLERKVAAREKAAIGTNQLSWQQISIQDQVKGAEPEDRLALGIAMVFYYTPLSVLSTNGFGGALSLDVLRWVRVGVRYQFAITNPLGHPHDTHNLGLQVGVGYGLGYGRFWGWVGVLAEPRLTIRALQESNETFINVGVAFGPRLNLDAHITPQFAIRAEASGGMHVIFFDQANLIRPFFDVGLGIVWRI